MSPRRSAAPFLLSFYWVFTPISAFLVFLFFSFLVSLNFLKSVKKYEVLLIYLFLLFLIFLVSEGLLFVSFFWTSFHSLSSPTLGISQREGFYLPDPCELTFANTILSRTTLSLSFFKKISLVSF